MIIESGALDLLTLTSWEMGVRPARTRSLFGTD